MREIKFRVYDIKKKLFTNYQIKDDMIFCMDKITGVWIRVKDESRFKIMQYTGLKDKNGVEIYEGDILAPLIINDYGNTESMVITYQKGAFGYYCKKHDWFETLHDSYVEGLEVIGNVYDNPELLDEESD